MQHELLGLDRIAVVDTGDVEQGDVEHHAAGLDGFGKAEKIADFRLVTDRAGTGPQLVMAAGLQAHDVVKLDQLSVVINYLLFLFQLRSINILTKQLLSFKNN